MKVQYGEHTFHMENWTIHRLDGPSMLTPNSQEWFKNGKPHREDGPARLFKTNQQGQQFHCEWWMEGKFMTAALVNEETFNTYWKDEQ